MAVKGSIEEKFIMEATQSGDLAGAGAFAKRWAQWLRACSSLETALFPPLSIADADADADYVIEHTKWIIAK